MNKKSKTKVEIEVVPNDIIVITGGSPAMYCNMALVKFKKYSEIKFQMKEEFIQIGEYITGLFVDAGFALKISQGEAVGVNLRTGQKVDVIQIIIEKVKNA